MRGETFPRGVKKVLQLELLHRLGLPYPRTRVVHAPERAAERRITRVEVLGGRLPYAIRVYLDCSHFNFRLYWKTRSRGTPNT